MKGTLIARQGREVHEIPLGSAAHARNHCCDLVFENLPAGCYQLALYYSDSRHGAYQIPVADDVSTVASDEQRSQWDNVLVPVIPRAYLTSEADRMDASYPRCDLQTRIGWIYIYLDGRLWRELQVLPEGGVKDVNLSFEKGLDKREATAGGDYLVALPYKVKGRTPLIEMCYSEVQWDWARIDALGGMGEEDLRQNHGVAVSPGDSSAAAVQLRKQRMQCIDLSAYPDFSHTDGPVGPADESHVALRKRRHLRTWHDSGLPVVYLHDPLGVAKELAAEIIVSKQRYLNGRNQAAEAAGSKHAMAEIVFQMGLGSPTAADLVDMNELRDLLQWDRQIAHLHELEEAVVALGKYITRAPQPRVPDVHIAMQDYTEHADLESLLQGQLLSSELVENLIYGDGRHYLAQSLTQPDHFLVGALNPSQRKIEIFGKNINKIAEFFENLAAAAQIDPPLEKQVFELFARIIEQISDGEYTLAQGNFDLAPLLAGSTAAGAKGGYLSSSFTALVRGRFDVAQWVVVKKGFSRQMVLTLGRSMEWLQAHQPLIKLNAVRLFGVLEVMNLGKAVAGMKDEQGGGQEARAYGATFTLISLGFTYLKDVKQLGAGWDNMELPDWQQRRFRLKRIFVAGGAHGFGFVGNVIIVALAWNDAWAAYKKGDTGGAVAATVAALGSTILAAATTLGGVVELNTLRTAGFTGAQAARAAAYGKANVPLSRYFQVSRVGAGTFIGIAVLVVGGVLMYYFSRTPLEHFLARGPFGRNKSKRYQGSREFESWRDDAIAEATLCNLLFSPTLDPSLERSGNGYKVDLRIHLPLLFEGKTRIDHGLYGLPPMGLCKSAEKRVIPPSSEGQLTPNPDGSHTLKLIYDSEAIKGFVTYEAQALVDLYGDGSQVLPVKIENAALAGHAPVVVQFPEVLKS
jgi:hypothetical protein